MKIDTQKLTRLVEGALDDIRGFCCKSEVSIAKIDGVVFTLSAYDSVGAEDEMIDDPVEAHVCIEKVADHG